MAVAKVKPSSTMDEDPPSLIHRKVDQCRSEQTGILAFSGFRDNLGLNELASISVLFLFPLVELGNRPVIAHHSGPDFTWLPFAIFEGDWSAHTNQDTTFVIIKEGSG